MSDPMNDKLSSLARPLRIRSRLGRMRNLCSRLLHKLLHSVSQAECAVRASGACTLAFALPAGAAAQAGRMPKSSNRLLDDCL